MSWKPYERNVLRKWWLGVWDELNDKVRSIWDFQGHWSEEVRSLSTEKK